MARDKKHVIVLRINKRSGFRTEFSVLLNEHLLTGKVVKTMVKGKEVWRTYWKDKTLDHYNPEWLARRNSRIVTLGDDHPSMAQAVAYRKAKEAEAAIATPAPVVEADPLKPAA